MSAGHHAAAALLTFDLDFDLLLPWNRVDTYIRFKVSVYTVAPNKVSGNV